MIKIDKIAVLLIGEQNSGKTTTINHFDFKYNRNDKLKSRSRAGWRDLRLYRDAFEDISFWIYFVPASPTETNWPLDKRLGDLKPEMLLVAEQFEGEEYEDSLKTLKERGYEIIEINIGASATEEIWNPWTEDNFDSIISERVKEIRNHYVNFVTNKLN